MKDKDYFTKHFRSDEYGEYVAISSTKFKMIVRQYREYESYCIELEAENDKLKEFVKDCSISHEESKFKYRAQVLLREIETPKGE